MMNKRFFDMVKYAKKRGLRVGIISNGSMFTESMVEKICDSRLDYIEISIDAADPERFRESRVGGDLEKIWEGIERLTTHRNRRGLTRPILAVRGTLFSYSQNDIPEIVREAKKRGVDAVGPFQPLNRKESYIEIYPEDKKRHLEDTGQVVQSIRRGVVRSELPFLMEFRFQDADGEEALESWPNLLRQSCDIGSMYSLLSGDVTPCCDIMTPTTPAWNLAKHGMEAVVRDELYENMRFNLWNGFYLDRCQSCRGYTVGLMAGKRPSLPQA
jgi:MoaA/NifB/PqqE/SkfB family radical SAM enzyme